MDHALVCTSIQVQSAQTGTLWKAIDIFKSLKCFTDLHQRQHQREILIIIKADYKWNQMDVGMSSIQAYKAHKQEGTLVSKVHKQGAFGTSSNIPTSVAALHVKQPISFFNLFQSCCSISLNCSHWLAYPQIIMQPLMCRVLLVCAPCLPVFLLVCVLCRPVCWTYLHPFDFIWNLFNGLFVHFLNK